MEFPVSPGASPRVSENQDVKEKCRELRLEDQERLLERSRISFERDG